MNIIPIFQSVFQFVYPYVLLAQYLTISVSFLVFSVFFVSLGLAFNQSHLVAVSLTLTLSKTVSFLSIVFSLSVALNLYLSWSLSLSDSHSSSQPFSQSCPQVPHSFSHSPRAYISLEQFLSISHSFSQYPAWALMTSAVEGQ